MTIKDSSGPAGDLRDSVVVRFAGDSGDGMQLTGSQFAVSTALAGRGLSTFPDFPAEIRAPVGTTFGVSAYQINFGSEDVMTAGDAPDVLVAMNPAALKVNIDRIPEGGLILVDTGSFTERNLAKAGFDSNPLEGDELSKFQVIEIDVSKLTLDAVAEFGLGKADALRCKNMWTLGLMLWMFDRERQPITDWLSEKFAKLEAIRESNIAALNAGHAFGETAELSGGLKQYHVKDAKKTPGTYRTVTGAQAIAWGLVAGGQLAELPIFFGSYPITPASSVLHELSALKAFDVQTFQAEDEIAAICSAIGASYAGNVGVTSSSGPGIALKTEAMGLAISAELPLVIVNSQRGGPSTGLPTKTEQSDLYQALYGRNADSPMPVIASRSPSDSFYCAIEAVRLAVKYMTPVILLTDGYIANAAEPWLLPNLNELESFPVSFATSDDIDSDGRFNPLKRDETTLARVWPKPGTAGLEYRTGGIEKAFDTGDISYDPANHQKMSDVRHQKISGIANDIPLQGIEQGNSSGDLVVVGWGSTYGPINQAVHRARQQGLDVAQVHIRHLAPFPSNLGDVLAGYRRVLVPEMNMGQLITALRDKYLVPACPLNKVSGQPFKIQEILDAIHQNVSAQAAE
ncbi:MAG: 2-oxoacid:acceptor oxidoreductase subunit alpha [Alphaproteobacteria bacterium]|nr:MAG: 2-oxoacid:acceptor oxidoreductase subunit alpha [Alphaproteobacteria bacterium]